MLKVFPPVVTRFHVEVALSETSATVRGPETSVESVTTRTRMSLVDVVVMVGANQADTAEHVTQWTGAGVPSWDGAENP